MRSHLAVILAGLAAAAWADAGPREATGADAEKPVPCWHSGKRIHGAIVNYAVVKNPAANYQVLLGRFSFADVQGRGVIVTNGTFFDVPTKSVLGVVVSSGRRADPAPVDFITRDGRHVNLGKRWGVGVRSSDHRLAVVRDRDAGSMQTYLGGGGILLWGSRGPRVDWRDDAAMNWNGYVDPDPAEEKTGAPNFPDDYRRRRVGRTALGIKTDSDGRQELLVVGVEPGPGTTVPQLAAIMHDLGATDAVFYDGGDATAFSAGFSHARAPRVSPHGSEIVNPTHIVILGCGK